MTYKPDRTDVLNAISAERGDVVYLNPESEYPSIQMASVGEYHPSGKQDDPDLRPTTAELPYDEITMQLHHVTRRRCCGSTKSTRYYSLRSV